VNGDTIPIVVRDRLTFITVTELALWHTLPPLCKTPEVISAGVKQLHDLVVMKLTDHLYPCQIRNTKKCISTPPNAFTAWCLIKQKNVIFILHTCSDVWRYHSITIRTS